MLLQSFCCWNRNRVYFARFFLSCCCVWNALSTPTHSGVKISISLTTVYAKPTNNSTGMLAMSEKLVIIWGEFLCSNISASIQILSSTVPTFSRNHNNDIFGAIFLQNIIALPTVNKFIFGALKLRSLTLKSQTSIVHFSENKWKIIRHLYSNYIFRQKSTYLTRICWFFQVRIRDFVFFGIIAYFAILCKGTSRQSFPFIKVILEAWPSIDEIDLN